MKDRKFNGRKRDKSLLEHVRRQQVHQPFVDSLRSNEGGIRHVGSPKSTEVGVDEAEARENIDMNWTYDELPSLNILNSTHMEVCQHCRYNCYYCVCVDKRSKVYLNGNF